MSEICLLAINLAKNSFQVCGVRSDGVVVFNGSVTRARLVQLVSDQEPCVVAMEACATSRHRGHVAMARGHEERAIPAIYSRPFAKRQKNDFANAAAIADPLAAASDRRRAIRASRPRSCSQAGISTARLRSLASKRKRPSLCRGDSSNVEVALRCFAQAKTRLFRSGSMSLIYLLFLVAGTGFEPVTFRL